MTQRRFVAFERLEYMNVDKMLLTLDLCRSITWYSLLYCWQTPILQQWWCTIKVHESYSLLVLRLCEMWLQMVPGRTVYRTCSLVGSRAWIWRSTSSARLHQATYTLDVTGDATTMEGPVAKSEPGAKDAATCHSAPVTAMSGVEDVKVRAECGVCRPSVVVHLSTL